MSVPCDCRWEDVDRPGIPVAPMIIRFLDGRRSERIAEIVMRVAHMKPLGLYRCVRCGARVFIDAWAQPVFLAEGQAPPSAAG